MRALGLVGSKEPLSLLCIGAHSDDIEIGAGGMILELIRRGARLDVHWVVLSAVGRRAEEARASAAGFLEGAAERRVELLEFRDGFFPMQAASLKEWFEGLKARSAPDLIFTHRRDDAHQDHRETAALTWNTFRDHLIFEYEVPKWDGDLGRPNTYMPIPKRVLERKVSLLMEHFASQRAKDWFEPGTFTALARLRGVECRAEEGFAEAFFAHKILL